MTKHCLNMCTMWFQGGLFVRPHRPTLKSYNMKAEKKLYDKYYSERLVKSSQHSKILSEHLLAIPRSQSNNLTGGGGGVLVEKLFC